jgi:hypothetical protein
MDKQMVIKLIKTADLEKCDMNQLIAILNLYSLLKIPHIEEVNNESD